MSQLLELSGIIYDSRSIMYILFHFKKSIKLSVYVIK